jgi:hypothetical protein
MSGDEEFTLTVDRVRNELASLPNQPQPEFWEYMLASDRLTEAAIVDPCVARFATAEVLTDDPRPPIGRFAPDRVRLDPPLGRKLAKKLEAADPTTLGAIRRGVIDALAFGYVATIDAEATHIETTGDNLFTVRLDRTAEDVWNYWVVSFVAGMKDALGRSYRRAVQGNVETRLENELRRLRLWPSPGKRTRLRATACTYADAGMLLRMAQTDNLTDEAFLSTWRHVTTNHWPYDDYEP